MARQSAFSAHGVLIVRRAGGQADDPKSKESGWRMLLTIESLLSIGKLT